MFVVTSRMLAPPETLCITDVRPYIFIAQSKLDVMYEFSAKIERPRADLLSNK